MAEIKRETAGRREPAAEEGAWPLRGGVAAAAASGVKVFGNAGHRLGVSATARVSHQGSGAPEAPSGH